MEVKQLGPSISRAMSDPELWQMEVLSGEGKEIRLLRCQNCQTLASKIVGFPTLRTLPDNRYKILDR